MSSTNTDLTTRSFTVEVGSGEELVPVTPNVANEVNRNPRTIKRWIVDKASGFPKTIRINNRLYVRRSDFETWKRERFEVGVTGWTNAKTAFAAA